MTDSYKTVNKRGSKNGSEFSEEDIVEIRHVQICHTYKVPATIVQEVAQMQSHLHI